MAASLVGHQVHTLWLTAILFIRAAVVRNLFQRLAMGRRQGESHDTVMCHSRRAWDRFPSHCTNTLLSDASAGESASQEMLSDLQVTSPFGDYQGLCSQDAFTGGTARGPLESAP